MKDKNIDINKPLEIDIESSALRDDLRPEVLIHLLRMLGSVEY